jgi:hypothetical protein
MALSKIQTLIQKLSESEKVKKVIGDIQTLSTDIQKKVKTLNTDEAVRKYKEIVKKVSKAEKDLEKEVSKVVVKVKKSATEIEKNLSAYKKKAVAQKVEIEKILKSKRPVTNKKAVKKAVKRAPKKRAVTKAIAK